jgi:hypothetical protein
MSRALKEELVHFCVFVLALYYDTVRDANTKALRSGFSFANVGRDWTIIQKEYVSIKDLWKDTSQKG